MSASDLRFKIIEEKFGTLLSYKLYDSETGEYVSILPSHGGAINGMALRHNEGLIEIMAGYSSEEELKSTLDTSFRGSNLFPFPNRIRNGHYFFNDRDHQLQVNFPQESNAIHGLVFSTPFKVADNEDGEIGCTLILEYCSKPAEGYPYQYLVKIVYRLHEASGFECKLKVANLMDQSIPIGQGWHPYFIAGSEKVDDLLLQFPAESVLEVDERNIPTGNKETFHAFTALNKIGKTVLDNCFELEQKADTAETIICNQAKNFGYRIWQETGKYKYNYLQVYTPPDRKSIAIEPMTCAPDAFNNNKGLIVLAPLESIYTSWGIKHLGTEIFR